MNFPKGAIKSIDEFKALFSDGKPRNIYEASPRHCTDGKPWARSVTGRIVALDNSDGTKFIGFALNGHFYPPDGTKTVKCIDLPPSCKDAHLLPQSYNDWYLFVNEEDALAYIKGGQDETSD